MPLERVKTGYSAVYCRNQYQYRMQPQKRLKTRLNQSVKNAAWVDQLHRKPNQKTIDQPKRQNDVSNHLIKNLNFFGFVPLLLCTFREIRFLP